MGRVTFVTRSTGIISVSIHYKSIGWLNVADILIKLELTAYVLSLKRSATYFRWWLLYHMSYCVKTILYITMIQIQRATVQLQPLRLRESL